MKAKITLFIIFALLNFNSLLIAAENQAVGKLMFTIGKVVIVNASGKSKRVRRGAKIFEGDLIKTNHKGQAQIKFKDGARISVRSSSEFKVDAYTYTEKGDKSKFKSELSLLKGGIRSITGSIGKSNKKSYKLKTVIATIGIRGTDYSLMLCNQDCNGKGGASASNGLYVGVVNGGVTLKNDVGTMDVSPNQYAMVGSAQSMPIMLPKAPSFLMFDKTTASKTERRKMAKTIAKRQAAAKKSTPRSNSNRKASSQEKSGQTSKNQAKTNRGKQVASSSSRQRQNEQKKDANSQSNTVVQKTDNTESNSSNTEETQVSESDNVTATTSEVSNTDSSDDSMETIIDDRYTENSDTELSVDIAGVEVKIEIEAASNLESTGFITESIDSQIANNIEPDAETIETITVASLTDEIDPNSNMLVAVPLPENALTKFFSFIFGTDNSQNDLEITLDSSNKIDRIDVIDNADISRSTYVEYSLGSAKQFDFGFDPGTGLSWGRWSSGNINQTISVSEGATADTIDMTNQSLHWISGPEGSDTITLPITGVRNFVLIGNTNPTDTLGNVGLLGSASLTADFDAETVAAEVNLSINQRIWQGSQSNIPLNMNNGVFNSDQMNVEVIDGSNTGGSIAGGLIDGTSNGGGFSYRLGASINGEVNQVSGAAAFKEAP